MSLKMSIALTITFLLCLSKHNAPVDTRGASDFKQVNACLFWLQPIVILLPSENCKNGIIAVGNDIVCKTLYSIYSMFSLGVVITLSP